VAGYGLFSGGLRPILSGSVLLLELVASKLRARFLQISSFCYCVEDNASAGLCPSFVLEVLRPAVRSQLEQQGRHLFSRATLNGHLGNFVFLINEIFSP
jgi:hypothetical protein